LLKIEFTEEQFIRVFMKFCECLDEFNPNDKDELHGILKEFVMKNNKLPEPCCRICYVYDRSEGSCERYEGDDYENDYDPKMIYEKVEPNHVCKWFDNPYIIEKEEVKMKCYICEKEVGVSVAKSGAGSKPCHGECLIKQIKGEKEVENG